MTNKNEKMRAIANSHQMFDGAATVWMLPIATLRHNIAFTEAQTLFGITAEDWKDKASDAETMFYLVEGNMVDVEVDNVPDDSPFESEINGLKAYWDNRNGNMANNWEWFTACVTINVVYDLYTAYSETRRKMPEIKSELLKEPPPDIATDPKETGSGRKRSKKKSAATSSS